MRARDQSPEHGTEARGLLIFPYNGNGLEAVDCLGDAYRLDGFVDDQREKQGTGLCGYPVLPRAALAELADSAVLAVPGSPTSYTLRRTIIEGLGVGEHRFARVVHALARISPMASVGHNFLAMAGVVITSNAVVGNHVCILPNSVVHHDAQIGDWTLIGSNVSIAGGVRIGENCYIGSGSSIKNGVQVGARALIGLGSTVIRDIPAGVRAAGNPTRIIR